MTTLMRYWWKYMRFASAVDLYLAQRSGNLEMASSARATMAICDHQLDLLSVQ